MSSEKQSPPFDLSGLSYSFIVFLPLFKERREEIEGVLEHFFQRKKCRMFSESCLWYRLCFHWFMLFSSLSVLWAYGDIVL